jgi:hypothetical protein
VAFHSSFFNPRPRQRGNLASGERPDRKVLLYASVVGYKPAPSNQNKINPCILSERGKTKTTSLPDFLFREFLIFSHKSRVSSILA